MVGDMTEPMLSGAAAEKNNLRANHQKTLWLRYCDDPAPNIFGHDGLQIAKDSGFSEIGDLLYGMQYFNAALIVGFCTANIYFIASTDLVDALSAVDEQNPNEYKFLLSNYIAHKILHNFGSLTVAETSVFFRKVVQLSEFMYLMYMLSLINLSIFIALFAPFIAKRLNRVRGKSGDIASEQEAARLAELRRWRCVTSIFGYYLPFLSSFSAMRLLYYVAPVVIATQGYVIGYKVQQRLGCAANAFERVWVVLPLVKFVLSRLLFLIMGFDAFLVKYRMAGIYIDRDEITARSLLGTTVFLFQILGVVNLNFFVKERLFIFMFAGEEGCLDDDETARQEIWEALLARNVFKHFGFWKGSIVMLGFDDYDFQMLALNDNEVSDRKVKRATQQRQRQRQRRSVTASP